MKEMMNRRKLITAGLAVLVVCLIIAVYNLSRPDVRIEETMALEETTELVMESVTVPEITVAETAIEAETEESTEETEVQTTKADMEKRESPVEMETHPVTMTTEAVKETEPKLQVPEEAKLLEVFAQMPKEQLSAMKEGMTEKFEEMPESIVTQSAVLFVEEEYKAQGKDMDALQTQYILISGLKMLGLALLAMGAAIMVTFLSSQVAATLGKNLRNHVYRKVISFSGEELNHFSTASLITRSTNDVQQVQLLFTLLFRIVLYAPILGIGGVYKVFQTDASMTWILGLAVVVIMLFVALLFKIAMPKFTKLQYLIDELNLVSREILTGVPVIRAFSREKHEEERFEEANARLTKTNLFVNRCMTFMMPIMMRCV